MENTIFRFGIEFHWNFFFGRHRFVVFALPIRVALGVAVRGWPDNKM